MPCLLRSPLLLLPFLCQILLVGFLPQDIPLNSCSCYKSAIQTEIEKFFITNGVKFTAQSFEDAAIRLYNYLFRITLPQKYTVKLSNEIVAKNEYKELIKLFKEKLENGDNIIPWQSNTRCNPDFQDILFNHWNIKHLHLIADSNKRSDDTLLYIQNASTLYFLDVVKHPKGAEWNDFEILKNVCQNHWMQYIGFHKMSDDDPHFIECTLEPKIEDEKAIKEVYKRHVNIGFTIDGVSYMRDPFQGVVASGDNVKVINCYRELCNKIAVLSSYEFIDFKPDFFYCLGEITYGKNGVKYTVQL